MTENESRIFEEEVVEHQRQVAEQGYAEKNGERFYEVETGFGKIWYITVLARQKRIFKNAAIAHSLLSSGLKVKKAWLDQFVTDPYCGETLDYWMKLHCSADDIEYIDKVTEKAIAYFTDNLMEMFAVNISNYFNEAFFYGLIKTVGEELSDPPQTESVIFNDFVKFTVSQLKTRLDIKKASGRKSKRTGEQLQEIMFFYDSILPLVREAKKDYTLIKKKRNWTDSIKTLHPKLPANIIEKFDQKGLSPADLALIWVAEQFEIEPTEYLRKKIIETRNNANTENE